MSRLAMTAESTGMRRLERAMEAWLAFQMDGGQATKAEFLAEHDELRDLLEPMLQEVVAAEPLDDEQTLGDLRIRREVGRGGMGVVYEAWQASLDRQVAVKVLLPHIAQSPHAIALFKREAMTAAKLEHDGIVDVFSVGSEGDTHYLVMEYIDGAPLNKVIVEDRPLVGGGEPEPDIHRQKSYVRQAVQLVADLADALHHAHTEGVVHRDVKPANVLLRPDGRAVLTDFGVAREEGTPGLTFRTGLAGTPYYASPEQARGEQVDRRTDVYSLGVTLYELLTHSRPFEGRTSQVVLQSILTREPIQPQRLNDTLSPDLVAVMAKAMEKDAANRYATAAAMAQDLRNVLDKRPVSARRLTPLHQLQRWMRRNPLRAGLVATLLLAVPTLSMLGGYVLASQTEIAAGQQKIREDRIEAAMAGGYLALVEGELSRALEGFAAVLELDPANAEVVAGVALAKALQGSYGEALAYLDSQPPAVKALTANGVVKVAALRLQARPKPYSVDHRLPKLATAHDYFVAGVVDRCLRLISVESNGQRGRALRRIQEAITRSPQARRAYFYVWVSVAGRAENFDSQVMAADAIRRLWPNDPRTFRVLGRAYTRLQPGLALELLERARQRQPESMVLRMDTARLHEVHGRPAEAARCLLPALAYKCQQGIGPNGMLARIREAQGDFDEAERLYRLDIDRLGAPRRYRALSKFYSRRKDVKKQERTLREGLRTNPSSALLAHDLGIHLYRADMYAEAVPFLSMTASVGLGNGSTWRALGLSFVRLRRFKESVDPLRNAVPLLPQDDLVQYRLSQALARCGQHEEALKWAERVVAMRPDSVRAHYHLGLLLFRSGHEREAIPHARLALQKETARRVHGYQAVARSLVRMGKQQQARTLLELLREYDSNNKTTHSMLEALLRRQEDWRGLKMECQRWVALNSKARSRWQALAALLEDTELPQSERDRNLLKVVRRMLARLGEEGK